MSEYILIKHGVASGDKIVQNVTFKLVHGLKVGKQGPYVKVNGKEVAGWPSRNFKVFVNEGEYEIVDANEIAPSDNEILASLSDAEVIEGQQQMFDDLAELTDATRVGALRSMIVSGDAGLGKSYTVEETLNQSMIYDKIQNQKASFEILKGDISPINLYMKLYEFSDRGQVLVLDDCDEILFDAGALNMLKAALDTSPKRWISYHKESKVLEENGVPNRFQYSGSVIFITNIDFERQIDRGTKNSPHYAALISRSHYVNVHLNTKREKWLRMLSVTRMGMLNEFNLTDGEQKEVLDFVSEHFDNLREMSLRTVIKVAQLRAASKKRWKQLASTSVLRKRPVKTKKQLAEMKEEAM